MSQKDEKTTTKELVDYFWKEEEIFNITAMGQVYEIGMEDMFLLYRNGLAKLDIVKKPAFLAE